MTTDAPHSRMSDGLWVQESGADSDVVVVLIHGSLDRSAGMARISRCIKDHRVIRFDRRGYGKSHRRPGPYSVGGNADDVEMLLNGRPAVLVGHSYGGNVAIAAASRLGRQIVGVSTYETPLSWQPWWPSSSAGAAAVEADAEVAAENFMVRLIGRTRWDALPAATKQQRRREGPTLKEELTDLRRGSPWVAGSVLCPVYAGHGSRGSEHHRRGAEWIAREVPSGSLVSIEGASHGAPMTHPREFVDQLVLPHLDGRSTFNVTC